MEFESYRECVQWVSGGLKSVQASVWEQILTMLQNGAQENINAKIFPSGWLSPEGEFINVPYGNHEDVAKEIINNRVGKPQDSPQDFSRRLLYGEDPATILETIGWVRISCGVIRYDWLNTPNFSEEQIICLREILKNSGRENEIGEILELWER